MKGDVVKFNKERGFGFVRIASWQDDVFVHISDVENREPLSVGQKVKFDLERTSKGPRAVNVRLAQQSAERKRPAKPPFLPIAAAVVAGVSIAAIWFFGLHWLVALLVAVNAATLGYWGWDKSAAAYGASRVPEAVLLALALAGGSPSALLGTWLFRHKSAKTSFRLALGSVLALQIAACLLLYALLKPS